MNAYENIISSKFSNLFKIILKELEMIEISNNRGIKVKTHALCKKKKCVHTMLSQKLNFKTVRIV